MSLLKNNRPANCQVCLVGSFVIFAMSIVLGAAEVSKETFDTDQKLTKLYNESKFRDALPVAIKLANLYESQLGPCAATGNAYSTIGDIYGRLGDLENFLKYKDKNFQLTKQEYGPNSLNYAYALEAMFEAYYYVGDYIKSTECIYRAYDIIKILYGENHWEAAATLSQIGVMLSTLGDKEKASKCYLKSYEILRGEREKRKISGNILQRDAFTDKVRDEQAITQRLLLVLQCLSNCNSALGNDEALKWANESCKFVDTLSMQNNDYKSASLTLLASCLEAKGNYHEAEKALRQNLDLWDGAEDEFVHKANGIAQLGNLYFNQQRYKDALGCFDQAMALLREGKYGEKSDGFYSHQRSLCNKALGNSDQAEDITTRSVQQEEKQLYNVLGLSEKERLGWQALNFGFSYIVATLQPHDAHECLLKRKGVVLDSLMEDRAAGLNSEGSKILNTLQNLKSQLAAVENAAEPDNRRDRESFEGDIAANERKLAKMFSKYGATRRSAQVTLEEVSSGMPDDSTLVDIAKFKNAYPPFDWRYGAFVMPKNGKSVFIALGNAAAIDSKVNALNSCIMNGDQVAFNKALEVISEAVWKPLAATFKPNQNEIIICPDGSLSFLPFACLLNSDQTLASEIYKIFYVGSARDLAKKSAGKTSKSMALIANPQFDATAKNAKTTDLVAMRSAEADVFGSITLPPLPGTEAEATSLQALAAESGWQTKSYIGKDATETSVRNTKKPGVLHLATHGFYLNSFTPPAPEGSRGMSVVRITQKPEEKKKNEKGVDPMRASGVALTGAQQTLNSWSHKKAPDPETDGVITAEEVGALDLNGTWMVVLSACETGVGEARSGEGVFGLRRAFMIAGAQNLLMTLWPVADETTASIMADFYKEALSTGDAAGSLAKVQRDWLVKIRKERGLLVAVREAGPFAMVVMANPNTKVEFVEGKMEAQSPNAITNSKSVSNVQRVSEARQPNVDESDNKPAVTNSPSEDKVNQLINAANSGDTVAMNALGIMYAKGDYVPLDRQKALEWFNKSFKAGDRDGAIYVEALTVPGDNASPKAKRAREMFSNPSSASADLANPRGFAVALPGGEKERVNQQNTSKHSSVLQFDEALTQADEGDAYAQAVVSIYYGLGLGCDQDAAKSKDYVMLSAKQQNPLGIYRLAEMRESGEGMEQNTEQAAQLMKKAKPGLQKLSSDPYALTALATIYERENPASQKIRELLTKASAMGYEPAQTKLSQYHTNQ